ncbi:hypothetical protein BLNAU_6178 [Blattamonas nauphoetae]|uniref:Uncharacterized protein n=1 Tax=Blattamonas nauphoetae TaxID=2049346 RepID=A0ABQ9Y5I2_9EUKA|nr:hypothetical protein BLNAU_6178 [Blattamonas nauphoetae]
MTPVKSAERFDSSTILHRAVEDMKGRDESAEFHVCSRDTTFSSKSEGDDAMIMRRNHTPLVWEHNQVAEVIASLLTSTHSNSM